MYLAMLSDTLHCVPMFSNITCRRQMINFECTGIEFTNLEISQHSENLSRGRCMLCCNTGM